MAARVTAPRIQASSLLGRARADLRALLLMAGVVALTVMLVSAVPPVTERAADRAVADAVAGAGTAGTLTATTPVRQLETSTVRDPRAADAVRQDVAVARLDLPSRLSAVLHRPVGSVSSAELQVLGGRPGRYLRLSYVTDPRAAPSVTWVEGRRPAGTVSGTTVSSAGASPGPVQVGLSRPAASALGVRVGERLSTVDSKSRGVVVRVTGLFVADDEAADAWQADPRLLRPSGGGHASARVSATALLSDQSLPDLPLAVPADDLVRRVTFSPQAASLRYARTASLARAVVGVKASTSANADGSTSRSWDSQLDSVLRRAHDRAATARAQAAVLVLGLVGVAGLVLALGAQLLVRRRAVALVVARERGAGLGVVAAELLVESLVVTTVAVALGLGTTYLLVGSASLSWSLPVALVGVLAVPALGTWAAVAATSGRRVPANRGARRRLLVARRLRRVVAETAVVVLAVAAVVALRQRGVAGRRDGDGDVDLLAASAPTLVMVLGALAVARVVPLLARVAVSRLRRSARAVPFFASAGAQVEAGRPLPVLVVVLAVAQLSFAVALGVTLEDGQSLGAWRSVGADARLQAEPSPALVPLARGLAGAPGVQAAVSARVADGVLASAGTRAAVVQLVVVDARAYARLLAGTPYPAPQLRRLAAGRGPAVPALVSGGLSDSRGGVVVTWQDAEVPLRRVGSPPVISGGSGPVVVVDAGAFAAARQQAPPGTLWAVGPGSVRALAKSRVEAGAVAPVVDRRAVLAERRAAPLVHGLVELVVVGGVLLVLLGVVGVLLGAAVGAPERLTGLARLRTMGLSRRQARRVLAGQVVPQVLVAVVTGLLLGAACAAGMLSLLDLQLLTGAESPAVVPWWTALVALPVLLAAAVVPVLESSRRGPALGDLLRVGR